MQQVPKLQFERCSLHSQVLQKFNLYSLSLRITAVLPAGAVVVVAAVACSSSCSSSSTKRTIVIGQAIVRSTYIQTLSFLTSHRFTGQTTQGGILS